MIEPKPSDDIGRRRLVAMAGHQGAEDTARQALADPSGDVRATALGALRRMGRLEPADVQGGLTDPSPVVRRRACEVSVAVPVPITALLQDPEPLVVEATCFALGERGPGESSADAIAALATVAGNHDDPLCREAAIAALGAVGDRAGLPAILAGLDDRPAVRRRAVLALAPFDGVVVEAALARARTDKDWQVRQAAEDLS